MAGPQKAGINPAGHAMVTVSCLAQDTLTKMPNQLVEIADIFDKNRGEACTPHHHPDILMCMALTPIISLQEASKGFSEAPLFSGLSLTVHEQERLALIGNNGSGKSTLLKILAGIEDLDGGVISFRKGLQCAYVPQQDIFPSNTTVGEVIENTLAKNGLDHYEIARRSNIYLGAVGFHDDSTRVDALSGGWKKRLSIACALALEPDCILLDEPTNHLDIESILWLEDYLDVARCALVFVSHDRYFIERLANRVLEINKIFPGHTIECDGGYSDYLERREERLEHLQQQRSSLANKVRREVEWLRQGVKARTTKSRARINEAHKLINTLKQTSTGEQRRPEVEFSSTQRKTKELIKTERVAQTLGGKQLFSEVSLVLSPGSRLAVVGPNGSGKTTFIRTLLAEIPPTAGRIIKATNLRVSFIDQARSQLRDDLTLREFLCPHGDSVVYQGQSLHVAAWASRFLFTHNHLATTLGSLSGGERARALLAKSMSQECDILLFDEPTNDLDIATLENLEESFESFPGAIVLITHDRYLLERSASVVLGLASGKGTLFSSYSQWEAAREKDKNGTSHKKEYSKNPDNKGKQATKLSYKDARELSSIEETIAKAEAKLSKVQAQIDSGEHSTNSAKLTELCDELVSQQQEVERLYSRWQELESMRQALEGGGKSPA
jgi:ATP-binding cassette subfamily F protein uup